MEDDEIRALVRMAIQKHLGTGAPVVTSGEPPTIPVLSISFGRYAIQRAPDEVMCLIEPAVRCNHCGYCQCHGH